MCVHFNFSSRSVIICRGIYEEIKSKYFLSAVNRKIILSFTSSLPLAPDRRRDEGLSVRQTAGSFFSVPS